VGLHLQPRCFLKFLFSGQCPIAKDYGRCIAAKKTILLRFGSLVRIVIIALDEVAWLGDIASLGICPIKTNTFLKDETRNLIFLAKQS
ncbi:hypothetical protein ACJX0J_009444, partial [Zea mays]